MKFPKSLLLATLAFQYSNSRVITKHSDFNYKFYCSKSNGNLCNTAKKDLKNAINSISSLIGKYK